MIRAVLGLALASLAETAAQPPILFEVRVFDGTQEVSAESHLAIYRAGNRTDAIAQVAPRAGRLEAKVAPGIYDLQVLQERNGRVQNIRWAERLVVMLYPDEAGHHLEVVNFKPGHGALEIRTKQPNVIPEAALYPPGARDKDVGGRTTGPGYALFVLPAGKYDIMLRLNGQPTWHTGVDVPLDRTRLWLPPDRAPAAVRPH